MPILTEERVLYTKEDVINIFQDVLNQSLLSKDTESIKKEPVNNNELYTIEDVKNLLKLEYKKFRTLKRLGIEMLIDPDYLSLMLSGKRNIGWCVLSYFGLEKINMYRKIKKNKEDICGK